MAESVRNWRSKPIVCDRSDHPFRFRFLFLFFRANLLGRQLKQVGLVTLVSLVVGATARTSESAAIVGD